MALSHSVAQPGGGVGFTPHEMPGGASLSFAGAALIANVLRKLLSGACHSLVACFGNVYCTASVTTYLWKATVDSRSKCPIRLLDAAVGPLWRLFLDMVKG